MHDKAKQGTKSRKKNKPKLETRFSETMGIRKSQAESKLSLNCNLLFSTIDRS